MTTRRVALAAIAILALGSSPTVRAEDPPAAPMPGSPGPAFQLTDLDGKVHSLAAYAGKTVVLEWLNFDCPFVARHYKSGNLPALQKKYTGQGVVWLAVNSAAAGKQGHADAATQKARAQGEGFAGTAILLDSTGATGKAYGAPVTPTMVVLDKQGVVRYWGALDDKPKGGEGAVNHVAAALDALAADKPVEVQRTKPYGCGVKY